MLYTSSSCVSNSSWCKSIGFCKRPLMLLLVASSTSCADVAAAYSSLSAMDPVLFNSSVSSSLLLVSILMISHMLIQHFPSASFHSATITGKIGRLPKANRHCLVFWYYVFGYTIFAFKQGYRCGLMILRLRLLRSFHQGQSQRP